MLPRVESVHKVYFLHGVPATAQAGYNPFQTVKNCARTAARINVQ